MSEIRRSHRAKKQVDYNKLANDDDDDDDDFVDDDFSLPPKKARKENVKKKEDHTRKDGLISTNKRDRSVLPGDQFFQQEIIRAQNASLSHTSSATVITTMAEVEDVRTAEKCAARLANTHSIDAVMRNQSSNSGIHDDDDADDDVEKKRSAARSTDDSDDYKEGSEEESETRDDTDDDDYKDDKMKKAKSKRKTAKKMNSCEAPRKAAAPPGGKSKVKDAATKSTQRPISASNPVKRTSLLQQHAQKVVWSPPGLSRCGKSPTAGITNKSPSSGLRLGLSRKANVKSLHSAVRVPQ